MSTELASAPPSFVATSLVKTLFRALWQELPRWGPLAVLDGVPSYLSTALATRWWDGYKLGAAIDWAPLFGALGIFLLGSCFSIYVFGVVMILVDARLRAAPLSLREAGTHAARRWWPLVETMSWRFVTILTLFAPGLILAALSFMMAGGGGGGDSGDSGDSGDGGMLARVAAQLGPMMLIAGLTVAALVYVMVGWAASYGCTMFEDVAGLAALSRSWQRCRGMRADLLGVAGRFALVVVPVYAMIALFGQALLPFSIVGSSLLCVVGHSVGGLYAGVYRALPKAI